MFWDILRKPYRIEIKYIDSNWDRYNGYVYDAGSYYVIRINRNLPLSKQRKVLKHELGHIYTNHLIKGAWKDQEQAEQEARRIADNMTDETLKKLLYKAKRIDFL